MSLTEFLEWDDGTDTRYELVRGKVVAMALPSASHSVIVANVGATLGWTSGAPLLRSERRRHLA
jgi:Uma2 family endonuclease